MSQNYNIIPKLTIPNNFTHLLCGDVLPAVGVLQKLLNSMGAKLDVNGVFDSATFLAVIEFRLNHGFFIPSGYVDKDTWDCLLDANRIQLPIHDYIDVCDITDSFFLKLINFIMGGDASEAELASIKKISNKYTTTGGASNGIDNVITGITMSASNLFLLRFRGHGSSGLMSLSGGRLEVSKNGDGSFLSLEDFDNSTITNSLMRLRKVFGPYGCVELHHCSVAKGTRGRAFVSKLADLWGVPVTAGLYPQIGGIALFTYRLEGTTFTACPGGISLSEWCRRLPDFPNRSVIPTVPLDYTPAY